MRWLTLVMMLLVCLAGCRGPDVDVSGMIERHAAGPVDVMPPSSVLEFEAPVPEKLPAPRKPREMLQQNVKQHAFIGPPIVDEDRSKDCAAALLMEEEQEQPPDKEKVHPLMDKRLQFDEKVLGFKFAPEIVLPRDGKPEEIQKAIDKQFPPLPKLPELPRGQAGPGDVPLTLADLQTQALRGNPLIRQALLDVEAAHGNAIQVGLYPNPTIGYETDTLNQAGSTGPYHSAGQQGGFIEQVIKSPGKLKLAREAAERDVKIAEQKLRQAEADVQALVRNHYFNVLSARKSFQITYSLTKLTDELFHVLLLQLKAGEVAAYEPAQIRVLAAQSRTLLIQSHNRYIASWKQLAASVGSPEMPLTELAGQIDMPVPHLEFDMVLDYVLRNHPDMVSANLMVDRDRLLVRLAEIQPRPDLSLHVTVSTDTTTAPYYITQNIFAGIPLPVFNRNQGNIHQARALLQKSLQESARARNDLTSRTAEAFARYESNRAMLKLYQEQMLPNQVQAFRAAVIRHALIGDKNVSYNDVVTAQQNLGTQIAGYLGVLADQWKAVVDIANLTQTRDLFQVHALDEVAPVPDIYEIGRRGLHHRR